METITDLRILKNHLSEGELVKIRQIAAKASYSEKEVKFVLSMAARSIKRLAKSVPSINNFEIKEEGQNYLVAGK
jgi:hypothetical protein